MYSLKVVAHDMIIDQLKFEDFYDLVDYLISFEDSFPFIIYADKDSAVNFREVFLYE